jgi:hypothetical protein
MPPAIVGLRSGWGTTNVSTVDTVLNRPDSSLRDGDRSPRPGMPTRFVVVRCAGLATPTAFRPVPVSVSPYTVMAVQRGHGGVRSWSPELTTLAELLLQAGNQRAARLLSLVQDAEAAE